MDMNNRFLAYSFWLALIGVSIPAWADPAGSGLAVLRREDASTVLLEADVRAADPDALIVRAGDYLEQGDVFLVKQSVLGSASEAYLERVSDWIEPLALKAAEGEIRIATLQGAAEFADPAQPSAFQPLQAGKILKEGFLIRVAEGGAVGLDVCSRHAVSLIGGSEGTLSRTQAGGKEQVVFNLAKGAAFSHVNAALNKENKVDFQVRTPQAVAAARGTDFVTVAYPGGTDVWIAEGEVELLTPQGQSVGKVSSEGGALGIIRFPVVAEEKARIEANSRTMGAAVQLIPAMNARLNGIKAKQKAGQALDAEELAILAGTKRFTYLVKARG